MKCNSHGLHKDCVAAFVIASVVVAGADVVVVAAFVVVVAVVLFVAVAVIE